MQQKLFLYRLEMQFHLQWGNVSGWQSNKHFNEPKSLQEDLASTYHGTVGHMWTKLAAWHTDTERGHYLH